MRPAPGFPSLPSSPSVLPGGVWGIRPRRVHSHPSWRRWQPAGGIPGNRHCRRPEAGGEPWLRRKPVPSPGQLAKPVRKGAPRNVRSRGSCYKGTIIPSVRPPSRVRNPMDGTNLNRLFPAAPGLKKRVRPRRSRRAMWLCPKTTTSKPPD